MPEIKFKITSDNLLKIINTIKDLSAIDKKGVIRFNKKYVLIYSLVGDGDVINVFKSFVFKTEEIFTNIDEFDETINFVVKDMKNLHRTLKIMVDLGDDVNGKIFFDELGKQFFSDRLYFKSTNKLKLNFYGSDPTKTNTKITLDQIKQIANIDNSSFNFVLQGDDFANIKKLAAPDEEMDIFYMNTFEKEGQYFVSLGETNWNLTLSEIELEEERTLAFPKKYFKTINIEDGSAKVYVFDTFLLVASENSNLIISIEITI